MLSYISSLDRSKNFGDQPKKIAILGSTGSIGCNVLKVVEQQPEAFEVLALAGGSNINLLMDQAIKWQPKILGLKDKNLVEELKKQIPKDYKPEIVFGQKGYASIASLAETDLVVSAQVGAVGLVPTLAAVRAGKIVALANKESLVLGGQLIRNICTSSQAVILPVDSEHNAIFQCLSGQRWEEVNKLILTASGGPFRNKEENFLEQVTPDQALQHPNWSMGAKITIDSATLMNKGLEIIEACHLFGAELEEIEVVIHPESIVHSLIEYQDGSWLANLGLPDMCVPIAYCLSYPRRLALEFKSLNLARLKKLTFFEPNDKLFPCLDLAKQAFRSGPSYPIVLNAANEISVKMFLQEQINFQEIAVLNKMALDNHKPRKIEQIKDIMEVDKQARKITTEKADKILKK